MMRLFSRALRFAGMMLMAISLIGGAGFLTLGADLAVPQVATFTGTQLQALILDPQDGFASSGISMKVTVAANDGAQTELTVNGEIVSATHIGRRVIDKRTNVTQFEYFGVQLHPGPNTLSVVPVAPSGERGAAVERTVFGPGPPVRIVGKLTGSLVADGKSDAKLIVTAYDQWDHYAMPGVDVQIRLLSGDVRLLGAPAPTDSTTAQQAAPATAPPDASGGPALVMPLGTNGTVFVPVKAGLTTGTARVRISSDAASEDVSFDIAPFLRQPLVSGLVSVGAGVVPAPVDGEGISDTGGAKHARAALFGSGAVGKKSALTFVYESQNRLAPLSSYGAFVENPNERPYQTYGDSSSIANDWQSDDHLYARLDSGRNWVKWGRFSAESGAPESPGAFRQLLSGASAHAAIGKASLDAFSARNETAFASTLMSVLGLSTLAQPLHPDIVIGSDQLSLVTLDRITGAILAQAPLVRNVDYTIDYATGTLRFINIPLPYDPNFNPQSVLVQYEYQGFGARSEVTGAGAKLPVGTSTLHLGYVNDYTGAQNFALISQTVTGGTNGARWSVSHAQSRGVAPNANGAGLPLVNGNGGNAWAFNYERRRGSDAVTVAYSTTGQGFSNPFGGLALPGFSIYHVGYSHGTPGKNEMRIEADGERNGGALGQSGSQSNVRWNWTHALGDKLAVVLGLESHSQSFGSNPSPQPSSQPYAANVSASFVQARGELDYHPTKHVRLDVARSQDVAGSGNGTTEPAQTVAEFSADVGANGRAYVRELISDSPIAPFAGAGGTGLNFGPSASRATQFGIANRFGANTTVSSDYYITSTGNGTDVFSAIGVQQKFVLSKALGGTFDFQQANASGGASGFTVWGGTLGWLGASGMRVNLAYQTRNGSAGGSTLSAGFAGPLSENLSVLGSLNHAYGASANAVNDRVSFAYRSNESDRLVSLLGWQRTNGITASAKDDVLSFEEFYRPWSGFEAAGRYAFKVDGDPFYRAHTKLLGMRLRQNVGRRLDVGIEGREMFVPGADRSNQTDFAAETGYQIGNSTRAAVGYTFRGTVDPTLTGQNAHRGVYMTLTTVVDRLFGWGKK